MVGEGIEKKADDFAAEVAAQMAAAKRADSGLQVTYRGAAPRSGLSFVSLLHLDCSYHPWRSAMTTTPPAYKRILLKLSGEALMGDDAFGINRATIERMVEEIAEVAAPGGAGGGGDWWWQHLPRHGRRSVGMDRATADYMGMLATVMNALALADAMSKEGMTARVMSAIDIDQVVEPYVRPKALQYLEEGKVVVFAAGTGNPFFTTDTAAALRGAEIGAEVVLKATKVDGVYTADPKKDPTATRYTKLTLRRGHRSRSLGIMDATAFALCRDQKLPIKVFSIFKPGALDARGDGRRRRHTGI